LKPSGPGIPADGTGTQRDSKRGRGRPPTHGLVALKRAVRALGGRAIDRRTSVGKQLAAWRAELIRDLGGDVSTQQAAIIDLAVKTKLMLDSIDAWLLTQRTLVFARRKSLLPAVRERMQLSDALARYLGQLGLERSGKDVPDLASYLAKRRKSDVPAKAPACGMSSGPPPDAGPVELVIPVGAADGDAADDAAVSARGGECK
jgi:hypothetical protein